MERRIVFKISTAVGLIAIGVAILAFGQDASTIAVIALAIALASFAANVLSSPTPHFTLTPAGVNDSRDLAPGAPRGAAAVARIGYRYLPNVGGKLVLFDEDENELASAILAYLGVEGLTRLRKELEQSERWTEVALVSDRRALHYLTHPETIVGKWNV